MITSRLLLIAASLLGAFPAWASEPVILDFGWGIPDQPAAGVSLVPPSPAAGAKSPEVVETGTRGKALEFDGAGRKLIYQRAESVGKAQTILAIVRADFEPEEDITGEGGRWVFDASSSKFRDVFRIWWRGSDLWLQTGASFTGDAPDGMTVRFSAEELGLVKSKWLFIGFSVESDGTAWGFVGPLAGKPILKRAEVAGTGKLPATPTKQFAIGGPLAAEPKAGNQITVDQMAVYPRHLTPAEILGAYELAVSGKGLSKEVPSATQAKVDALLAATPGKDVDPLQKERIVTDKMVLEFDQGWLTQWQNLETGETVNFGKPELTRTMENRHYAPGPWWVDWKLPANISATGTQWSMSAEKVDATAVRLTQTAERANDRPVHALQWGIRIPYDKVKLLHMPKGMPPSRLIGAGTLDMPLFPGPSYGGRTSLDAGNWALRFYVIEGQTGGLLIYMEDPELQHYGSLEFKKGKDEVLISNRSICPPPWKSKYTSSRWVVQQFTGGSNVAAQLYQDYLVKAYHLKKVVDRPTAWAKKLGFVFVGAPWAEPLPFPGMKRPMFNYTDGWEEGMRVNTQWLKNVSQVLDPKSVMFYTGSWKLIPNIDKGIPDAGIDPFFALMAPKARNMGYHVMLHFNGINMTTDTVIYARFWEGQAKIRGDKELRGPIRSLYTGLTIGKKEGAAPGGWTEKMGWNPPSGEFAMNPADQQWRYILVSQIVSAVKATGADALHIDVPVLIPDMNCVEYGMNSMEGWREFGKLLRTTLDESGLQHVAIATESTPCEALLPYVDFAQAMRSKSLVGIVDGAISGKYMQNEAAMILTQAGEERASLIRLRESMDKEEKKFNSEYAKLFFRNMKEFTEPSINNMVVGPYVQAYPHLGSAVPMHQGRRGSADDILRNQIIESLAVWASFIHDTPPSSSAWGWAMFMDVPPYDQLDVTQLYRRESLGDPGKSIRKNARIFSKFDYGKLALARFWEDQTPQLTAPGGWQKGDVAQYQLKDGRGLRIYRSDPDTMRLQLSDGSVLAEVDLFAGWKNDQVLMKGYEPTWLKDQIDDFAAPPVDLRSNMTSSTAESKESSR